MRAGKVWLPYATWGTLFAALLVGGACRFDVSGLPVQSSVSCGNGVREDPEYCDTADFGGATCASFNLGSGELRCTPDCTLDVTGCSQSAQCGNGIREGLEECDDGDTQDGDGCDHTCRIEVPPTCGNGTVDQGEECDDGNANERDACLSNCREARCGDRHVQEGVEQCEPGNVPQTCEGLGFASGTLGCRSDCTYDTTGCLRREGEPCTDPGQCDGRVCLDEVSMGWPGGTCSRACAPGQVGICPGGTTCVPIPNRGPHCLAPCTDSSMCRPGYACFRVDGTSVAVCWPHCTEDAQCSEPQICDPYQGRCASSVPGEGNYGGACASDRDCPGICLEDRSYCASYCSLSDRWCPSGGACVNMTGDTVGERGLCLKTCSPLGFDCTGSQHCDEIDGESVCWFWGTQ